MKVLVTGAAGFIGSAVAEHFTSQGDTVTGIDLRDGVDISQPGPWQDADADLIVHTAAFVGFRLRDPGQIWRVNVLGTRNVVVAAARAGARLVHLSSVTVFGFDFPDGVDETFPVRPSGVPYADTKIAAEQVVLQAHAAREVEASVVRPGDVYGPRSDAWATRPYEALKKRQFLLPRGTFSPVYVDDLVRGIAAVAAAPAGQVVNLAGGIGVPNERCFGPIAQLAGRRLRTVPLPVALASARAGETLRLNDDVNPLAVRYFTRRGTYSIARARGLGWEPRVGLDEGLANTLEWLRG